MSKFDPDQLRVLRKSKHITATELARRMDTSPAQIHRLEKGQRRLTVDSLLHYCDSIGVSVGNLFAPNEWVPVTGVIDSEFEILPLPPSSPDKTLAPSLTSDMKSLGALRWAAGRRFSTMRDHVVFYKRNLEGVPDSVWNKRCLILRADGSQCLGWPIRSNNSVHIDFSNGPHEFDVEIKWASPVIAVMPPFAIEALQAPAP